MADLRRELKNRGVTIPPKSLKADMQRLLKGAVKDSASSEDTTSKKRKKDEENQAAPAKKAKTSEPKKKKVWSITLTFISIF